MSDSFANHSVSLTAPATRSEAISPGDTLELCQVTRALYVGQPSNVRVKTVTGDIVTLANMLGGVLYPIRVQQVFATGTTATDLVGLS